MPYMPNDKLQEFIFATMGNYMLEMFQMLLFRFLGTPLPTEGQKSYNKTN